VFILEKNLTRILEKEIIIKRHVKLIACLSFFSSTTIGIDREKPKSTSNNDKNNEKSPDNFAIVLSKKQGRKPLEVVAS